MIISQRRNKLMLIETILGAASGIIGNVVGQFFKTKQAQIDLEGKKITNAHELAMVKAQTDSMIAENNANIKLEQTKVEGAIDLSDAQAYVKVQENSNKSSFDNKWIESLLSIQGNWKYITVPIACLIAVLFGVVDFLKELIRPSLTIYLCGASTWITYMSWKIMNMNGVVISSAQAVALFSEITSTIIYLTVSCVTWYYGDRRMSKTIIESMEKKKK
jgi:hypothetical protein